MPVCGSRPGPSLIEAAAALTPSTTWSKIFLCAYRRVPAQHTWPALKKIALAAPPTTVLMSASGRMMTGDLPPSSRETRFNVSVADLLMSLPTCGRAGEGHLVDARMGDERGAGGLAQAR